MYLATRRESTPYSTMMLGFSHISHTKYVRETFGIYSLLSIATRGVLALFLENDQTYVSLHVSCDICNLKL